MEKVPTPGDDAGGFDSVLSEARRLLRRGDTWEAENYDDLRAKCEEIGIHGEPATTIALRKSFEEISPCNIHQREERGYGGASGNQVLYEARWQSTHCGRFMYVKFALFDGRLVVVRFHQSTIIPLVPKGATYEVH